MRRALVRRLRLAGRSLRAVDYRGLLLVLGIGSVGGALLAWLGMPLAWMIGAILFSSIAALSGIRIAMPAGLRNSMVTILGVMLGSSFQPELFSRLGEWGMSLAGLIAFTAVSLAVGMLYLRRVGRYDPATAYFTAAPGGFNEMVLIGGAMGGDFRVIALSHSARVILVVFTVPAWFRLLAGYEPGAGGGLGPALTAIAPTEYLLLAAAAVAGVPLARWMRLPAHWLTGPMVVSAALHLGGLIDVRPPGIAVAAAQIVIGCYIGCRFVGTTLGQIGRTLLVAAGQAVVLLLVTVGFAIGVHTATGIPVADLVLAYAPGGLAEMSLIALALGVDAGFVATHHIVRILLIVAAAPPMFLILRRRMAAAPAQSGANSGAESGAPPDGS